MAKGTILVVDDNELNLELVRELLEGQGYQVHQAMRALDGISLAQSIRPDLILMDIRLPKLDGLSAVRRLKADPATAAIPVLALTASAMEGDERKAFEAGCDGYLTKPLNLLIFQDTLRRFLPPGAAK